MRLAKLTAFLAMCVFLVLLWSSRPSDARAQDNAAVGRVRPCGVSAYVIDQDTKGLNVPSGPGAAFKVIGNLPNQGVQGVGVHITGASGEWVRIDSATEQGGEEEPTFFSGEGWVYGPLLGTHGVGGIEGGAPIYREPSKESRVRAFKGEL